MNCNGDRAMRTRIVYLFALAMLIGPLAPATPERRVALVIGVGHYQAPQHELTNPANDARLIGSELEKLGFEVLPVIDPDYDTMKSALRDFSRRLDGANVALLYYSGHGMQVAGENYLLPTDARIERESDLRDVAFDVQGVLEKMDAPGRVNLLFLDACRDNPFSRSLAARFGNRSTAVGQGLAAIETQVSGTLIAYAAAPGEVAWDGNGTNSPFTSALARHIADPGLDVRQMLTRVRVEVQSATNGQPRPQRPWVSESLDADFFFVPQSSQLAPLASSPAGSATSPEIIFWELIAGSTNPADFEAYLRQFPQGSFTALAQARLTSFSPRPTSSPPLTSQSSSPLNPSIAQPIRLCDDLAADPDDIERQRNHLTVAQQIGDALKAVEVCTEAIVHSPVEPRLVYQRGRAYEAAGEVPEADADFQAAEREGYAPAIARHAHKLFAQARNDDQRKEAVKSFTSCTARVG